jgi:hypothetical protein
MDPIERIDREVPDASSAQDKFIAFMGRNP